MAALRKTADGHIPLETALDLFAAIYGAVPGGDPTRVDSSHLVEGTLVLRTVLGQWDALTPDQQEAVRAHLGYGSVQSFRPPMALDDDPATVAMQARVEGARGVIAGHMGADVAIPMRVVVTDELRPGVSGDSIAESGGTMQVAGAAEGCRIRLRTDASDQTVAHEVFHCFQYALAADVVDVYWGEDWIIEGSAEWAGVEVAGMDRTSSANFADWVLHHDGIVFLDYAAVGYFWTIEDMGASPWQVVPAMLGLGGEDAVAASGFAPEQVLRAMGPKATRGLSIDPIPVSSVWDFGISVPSWGERLAVAVTPAQPIDHEPVFGGLFAKGANLHATLEGGERVQVVMDADVGTLEFFGHDAISWSGGLSREFCMVEGGCRCGIDGSVDSGLEQGAPDLIVVPGESGFGPMVYTIIFSDDMFTDGHWTGTMTTSTLTAVGDTQFGTRSEATGPFEVTVEHGAVTSGSYSIAFAVSFDTPTGSAAGTASLSGVFTGCGSSPQMQQTGYAFDGTMTIAGETSSFSFTCTAACGSFTAVADGEGGSGTSGSTGFTRFDTLWAPDPITDPNSRTGLIDATGHAAAMGAGGFAVSGMEITFEATKTG